MIVKLWIRTISRTKHHALDDGIHAHGDAIDWIEYTQHTVSFALKLSFHLFSRHLETELKSCENPVTCCFFMVSIGHLAFWHPLTSFDQVVLLVCRFVSNLASRFPNQHPKRCHLTVWRQEDPFVMSNMGHTWATMVALNRRGDSEDSQLSRRFN